MTFKIKNLKKEDTLTETIIKHLAPISEGKKITKNVSMSKDGILAGISFSVEANSISDILDIVDCSSDRKICISKNEGEEGYSITMNPSYEEVDENYFTKI